MYTVCSQGHQEVPHTQDTIIIKDEVTRLEQGTVHPANKRLLGITRKNTPTVFYVGSKNTTIQVLPTGVQQHKNYMYC